ncbi:hypothetical protein DFH28DRAFT_1190502 [Melampsora americana]|nr:hypothetical protein DFH28DRAFT_1190502 [Melampsora americana]
MDHSTSTAAPEQSKRERNANLVYEFMNQINISPKDFIIEFLTSSKNHMPERRKYWASDRGWLSTKHVLETMRDLLTSTQAGKSNWKDWVFLEASKIVNQENPLPGVAPKGCYYNSNLIEPSFFDEESELIRESKIIGGMPFLHGLIKSKLEHCRLGRRRSKSEHSRGKHYVQENDLEANGLDALESIQYENPSEGSSLEEHRLNKLPMTVSSMIAFACNRRCNGLQLQNAVTLLACGVSARVHEYLFSIGLLSSRYTAVKAVDGLAKKAVINIKETLSKSYSIRPVLCVDNIDFETRIHHKRIEESTRQFHGSWGYCHIHKDTLQEAAISPESTLPPDDPGDLSLDSASSTPSDTTSKTSSDNQDARSDILLDDHPSEPNPYSSDKFLEAMQTTMNTPVLLSDFLPTHNDTIHWEQSVKAQLNQAWLELIIPGYKPTTQQSPKLDINPPTIEQIKVEMPSITMLKMMDSPENSAEGIGQLLVLIQKQMGIYNTPHATALQVLEGDLGTCINVEGLRNKRRPRLHADESLDHILTLPGAAHTLWNIGQAVLLHHWGDSENSEDSGAWRFWEALGGKSDRPVAKKDFTSMMTTLRKVHMATLAFCLKDTYKYQSKDLDIYDANQVKDVVDECFKDFFTAISLHKMEKSNNWHAYNLRLRLQDFASIIEGEDAMRQGDIGRVMLMWKRWSLMAQGMKGLSHYALHLPRMILLLESGLPPELAKLIKHSMLIPASGRPGHFIAKDFFLELQNYWLKYFYNHSGMGTDLKRLTDLYSVNITLVCDTVALEKSHSSLFK